jgi:DnaJ homolog subfamily B member 12
VRKARSRNLKPQATRPAPSSTPNASREQQGTRSAQAGSDKERDLVQRILRTKDYYDLLGVPRNASDDDLKKAYRRLALSLHPDKNKAQKAEEAFKLVNRAFDTLSDPTKRETYNRYGAAAVDGSAAGGGAAGHPFAGFGGTPNGFAQGDIDELLRSMFGGGGMHFGGGGFGMPGGFQQQQQPRHDQQRHHQQQAPPFQNPLAGIDWRMLAPFAPLLLMFAVQILGSLPFLFRNMHMVSMLYYFTPRSHRPMLGKLLAGLFLMRVLGMV